MFSRKGLGYRFRPVMCTKISVLDSFLIDRSKMTAQEKYFTDPNIVGIQDKSNFRMPVLEQFVLALYDKVI